MATVHGRSYAPETIVQTRIFARSTAVSLVTLGFIFMAVALASDRWGWLEINMPDRADIYVTRGLFGVSIGSHDGSDVYTHYFQEDAFGQEMDPYCGSASRPSVFATFLPVLAQQLNTTLPDKVCCGDGDGFVFAGNRDDDTNDWCQQRDAIIGTAISATVLAGVAVLATSAFCCARGTNHLVPFITFGFLSAALGLAASVIWAVWLQREDDDREDRDIAAEGDLRSGFGLIGFTIGWLLVGFGAFAELFACCSMKEVPPPPMQQIPYMISAYGAPVYSTQPPQPQQPSQAPPAAPQPTQGHPSAVSNGANSPHTAMAVAV
eukprot:m.34506 g.34506  ORF g.34506 m.34506 type:complete len:321 (+) comp12314_c0_seq1:177-1139(+)